MALLFQHGGQDVAISAQLQAAFLQDILAQMTQHIGKSPQKVLLLPPDISRFHSGAGLITQQLYQMLAPQAQVDIMPALGTHFPMTEQEIRTMFGSDIPLSCFLEHNWRTEVELVGEVSADMIREFSAGAVDYAIPVEVNWRLLTGQYDLILSIGQIVPHEVVGMANFTKNICVGVGGAEMIKKSHFIGAVYGMERMMGRIATPVRKTLDYACATFLGHLPIFFIMTVMQKQAGQMLMRGLYCGDQDDTAFRLGATLAQQVNLDLLDAPLSKVVVYLEPAEFRSTWLGNKAIYRLRMAMADDGELIILAPGLRTFGEDPDNDRLIRKYGYRGTPATMQAVADHAELRNNLSVAAHFIHGSSEGRFHVTYCPGAGVTQAEIEGVGYAYRPYADAAASYDPHTLQDGWNTLPNGETIFYVSNPALGLWALKEQFPPK